MNYYNTVIYHKKYELRNIFYLSANVYLSKILTIFFLYDNTINVCVGTRGVIYMLTYVHSVCVSLLDFAVNMSYGGVPQLSTNKAR